MKSRINYSSGALWEDIVGYSRAVKVGDLVEISGTTSVEGEKVIGIGDPFEQTKVIIEKFSSILEEAGGTLHNIVRVRIYVVKIEHWESISKAFFQYFKNIKPAATLVEVNSLILPELLVEMEATAILNTK
ncbi:MAG: RidA family protein [Ignavibacteriaceae bacterium]|jgi:enamine deaminase RidA (YjgF/YER057c/UK114 family)